MIDGSDPHTVPAAFAAATVGAASVRGRMGPGGLRGLQILRSGVYSVRGGFDSHAFPPFLVILMACIAGTGLAGSARAATGPAVAFTDTVVTGEPQGVPDAATEPGAAADSTRHGARARRGAAAAAKAARLPQPRWVMLRSLVVPGWGQATNGAWLKAGLVAASEGLLVWGVVGDQGALNRLAGDVTRARLSGDTDAEQSAVNAYNSRLDATTTREYLLGVVVLYALVDAYVDAHFRNFKVEFETDPALPDGPPPVTRARVGWELKF